MVHIRSNRDFGRETVLCHVIYYMPISVRKKYSLANWKKWMSNLRRWNRFLSSTNLSSMTNACGTRDKRSGSAQDKSFQRVIVR